MAKRRISGWWIALAAVALLVTLAGVAPSPYAVERPGPVVDALGEIETEAGEEVRVIRISGAETYETEGSLNVLSVSISGTPEQPSSWLSLAGALFDPTRAIVPLSQLYPSGMTGEQRTERTAAQMRGSQVSATAAALEQLGLPVSATLRVSGVTEGGPADGVLREGDAILSADGEPVTRIAELRSRLAAAGAGQAVTLEIERGGKRLELRVVPEEGENGEGPLLGVLVSTEFEFPFDVDLELDRIGGPSAGLVFALAVYDELTPGGLTGGLDVSGTGTIDEQGSVGPIGGLPQKLWGASLAGTDLMLMPLANCGDLPERLPEDMAVAPVATLQEAIDAVETAAAGGTPPGVERCEAAAAG